MFVAAAPLDISKRSRAGFGRLVIHGREEAEKEDGGGGGERRIPTEEEPGYRA